MLSNFIIKEIIAVFGGKNSLYFAIFIYAAASLLFIYGYNFITLVIGAILGGCYDQLVMVLLKIIMNELFDYEYTYYLPICYSGFAISPIINSIIMCIIINPNNERQSVEYVEDGQSIFYFS